jgi:hypothetical protein
MGGFFYLTLASVAAGMTASVVRWAVLDSVHARTGLRQPQWDDSFLARRLSAFDYLVENHYRYYQFYGNSAVALVFAYASWRCSDGSVGVPAGSIEAALVLLEVVFIAGSRDALRKYFQRSSALLGVEESEKTNDQRESSFSGKRGADCCEEAVGQKIGETHPSRSHHDRKKGEA